MAARPSANRCSRCTRRAGARGEDIGRAPSAASPCSASLTPMASEEGRQSWPSAVGAVIPLAIFGGVLAWWGLKSGGYFEVTFLPGTMILLGLAAAFLLFSPLLVTLRGAALVSLAGLVGLAAWTLISGLWSPVPAVAFSDSQRVLGYVAAFVVGAWSCLLLGRRMLLALSPLALAGALVGLVTLIVLWTGTNSTTSSRPTRPCAIRSATATRRRPSSSWRRCPRSCSASRASSPGRSGGFSSEPRR